MKLQKSHTPASNKKRGHLQHTANHLFLLHYLERLAGVESATYGFVEAVKVLVFQVFQELGLPAIDINWHLLVAKRTLLLN